MKRILHIITSLEAGGAQTIMYNLLNGIDSKKFERHVISLSGDGFYGDKLRLIGVIVHDIDLHSYKNNIQLLLAKCKDIRPHLINCWMPHANLIGSLLGLFILKCPIFWGIHNSRPNSRDVKLATRLITKLCCVLSWLTSVKIIYCSEQARIVYENIGYKKSKSIVINNGIDTSIFRPNKCAKNILCHQLGIDTNSPLVGYVARYHYLKNHKLFFRAASLLYEEIPDVKFILCGIGIDKNNISLLDLIKSNGLEDNIYLLGLRGDMEVLTAAFDVATSCSFDESFSLTTAEAMSCGTMVVITDNPGAKAVLGPCGWIVPADDPKALFEAWRSILNLSSEKKNAMGQRGRERVLEKYSLKRMISNYENIYESSLILSKSHEF